MAQIESSIYMKKIIERTPERLEARISLIDSVCQVFTRGFEEGDFTFKELKGACRFLSTLIRSFDDEVGDLCLLASHAENLEQFKPVCRISRQRWRKRAG